jgi:hypothetical protein
MSNNYTVRPMGADPRTSLTITDNEIIYRNGLIGSHEKRVSLQDARVSFSTLMKGGKITVREFGQEIFSVDGILNPKTFMAEFEARKNGEATIPKSGVQKIDDNIPLIAVNHKNVLSQRNFSEALDYYAYKGHTLDVTEISRLRIADEACDEIRTQLKSSFDRFSGSLFSAFSKSSILHYGRDVLVHVPSWHLSSNSDDKGITVCRGKIDQAMQEAYNAGQHDVWGTFSHTKEVVYSYGRSGIGISYHPETGTAACAIYKKEKGMFVINEAAYQGTGVEVFDNLDQAIGFAKEDMESNLSERKAMVGFGAIVLAGIFAATVAFGEEVPANDTLHYDPSDYTLQLEP